ncbi:hypothetical protein [Flavobacterium piscinae]|nr:hypothetical protein [Flavobacterium piscinae]
MSRIITSLILFVTLFVSQVLFGQSVFDKFDGPEDIKTIIVNKKCLK